MPPSRDTHGVDSPGPTHDPLAAVAELVSGFGVRARPLRDAVGRLTEGGQTLDSLVAATGLSRRTLEALLEALGRDVDTHRGERAIRPQRRHAYRERFGYRQLRETALNDPLAGRLAAAGRLVGELAELAAAVPAPLPTLDQVAATPETMARRALWMDSSYDLAGARLLCVGDHDLTALAACIVNPDLHATVVDVDERLLQFVDIEARRRGLAVRCLFADLRLGLPTAAYADADLVFTDPPYTPEGARLFLARGLAGLRDREHGRLLMAYGYGDRHPALGLRVQRAVQRLHLTYDAIFPNFSRYVGAQAVGSTSDLYVCRPTARTWKTLGGRVEETVTIYSRGRQAVEGRTHAWPPHVAAAVVDGASGPERLPVAVVAGERWPETPAGAVRAPVAGAVSGTLRVPGGRRPAAVAADLTDDPGSWLLRVLVAVEADRMAILVRGDHPDLTADGPRRDLAALVGHKYHLRVRRSTPDPRHAIVEASNVPTDTLGPAARVARWVLDRPHGKARNLWREGLVHASRGLGARALTKREARAIVDATPTHRESLDVPVLEMPRSQLRDLLHDIDISGTRPGGPS